MQVKKTSTAQMTTKELIRPSSVRKGNLDSNLSELSECMSLIEQETSNTYYLEQEGILVSDMEERDQTEDNSTRRKTQKAKQPKAGEKTPQARTSENEGQADKKPGPPTCAPQGKDQTRRPATEEEAPTRPNPPKGQKTPHDYNPTLGEEPKAHIPTAHSIETGEPGFPVFGLKWGQSFSLSELGKPPSRENEISESVITLIGRCMANDASPETTKTLLREWMGMCLISCTQELRDRAKNQEDRIKQLEKIIIEDTDIINGLRNEIQAMGSPNTKPRETQKDREPEPKTPPSHYQEYAKTEEPVEGEQLHTKAERNLDKALNAIIGKGYRFPSQGGGIFPASLMQYGCDSDHMFSAITKEPYYESILKRPDHLPKRVIVGDTLIKSEKLFRSRINFSKWEEIKGNDLYKWEEGN